MKLVKMRSESVQGRLRGFRLVFRRKPARRRAAPEANAGGVGRRLGPEGRAVEAHAGGVGRRPGPEGRAERPPELENFGGEFKLIGLDFGGLVIVEGIDDLEVVVMKIKEGVMDFEEKC